jgi:hypothetical protein
MRRERHRSVTVQDDQDRMLTSWVKLDQHDEKRENEV